MNEHEYEFKGRVYRNDPVRALMHVPVPLDRASWVRLLMAFKRAKGDEDRAREWSSHGEGYNEHGFRSTWKSIGMAGKIDARVLYAAASAYGYRPELVRDRDGKVPQ